MKVGTDKNYHYTYMSSDGHRYYIGVRSFDKHPLKDKYLGSYTDKTFKPTSKIILGLHHDRNDAMLAEKYWLILFKAHINPLFANQSISNEKFCRKNPPWNKGISTPHTESTKKKISETLKGHPVSPETREILSIASTGNKNCLGKKFTDEHKKKLSDAKKGLIPWNKGKKLSEKHKKKLSEAHSGKKHNYNKMGADNPLSNKSIFLFVNQKTNQIFLGNKFDFLNFLNVKLNCIHGMTSGHQRSYKNWVCTCLI